MSKIRVCFLGTPEFAVTALKALLEDEHYQVVGVITQPDRPAGRKLQLTPSPVKQLALAHNLKVLSPESLKSNRLIFDEVVTWKAEVAVVVAYGQILTEEFLKIFPFGCVNIHGSVLPRWRGAAPIQRSIEFGDSESGVTLQKVVKKLDAGDILGIRRVKLDSSINAQELYQQLAILGADLLHVELMDYLRGNLAPTPQDESLVTYAKKIEKTEAEIDWRLSADQIHNKVRAFVMGPGTFTMVNGKKFKIHKTRVHESLSTGAQPGSISQITNQQIIVQCGYGKIELIEVQPESRNKMPITDFLKGHSWQVGMVLGH